MSQTSKALSLSLVFNLPSHAYAQIRVRMRRNHSNYIPSLIYLIPVTTRDESLSRAIDTSACPAATPEKSSAQWKEEKEKEKGGGSHSSRASFDFRARDFFATTLHSIHSALFIHSRLSIPLSFSLSSSLCPSLWPFYTSVSLVLFLPRFASHSRARLFRRVCASSRVIIPFERKREKERVREDDPL